MAAERNGLDLTETVRDGDILLVPYGYHSTAAAHGYDLAARIDGDGQHDPAELVHVLGAVVRGEADASPAAIPLEVYFKENIPDKESE